jgi:tRNA threonylcarbamoyladenosine biosynthesis protein TsaB
VLTLALDTTTRGGSVAVTRGRDVLALVHGDATRTHGERLPAELERALGEAGVTARDLDLLVVASGPGAFTGLRIGLSAIQGMSMVLGLPVVAVSALDALARHIIDTHVIDRSAPLTQTIACWMDAQRGEVFASHYLAPFDLTMAVPPQTTPIVGTADVIMTAAPDLTKGAIFVGDGAVRYAAHIQQLTGATATIVAPPPALAPALAAIGEQLARSGASGPPHALQPLYVRRPDAELERVRKAQT